MKVKYVKKTHGTVSLIVNDVLIIKKKFDTTKERREIMSEWSRAFETSPKICFQIAHYESEVETKDLKVTNHKRVFDIPRVAIKEKEEIQFERPKAVYSNKDYSDITAF